LPERWICRLRPGWRRSWMRWLWAKLIGEK